MGETAPPLEEGLVNGEKAEQEASNDLQYPWRGHLSGPRRLEEGFDRGSGTAEALAGICRSVRPRPPPDRSRWRETQWCQLRQVGLARCKSFKRRCAGGEFH